MQSLSEARAGIAELLSGDIRFEGVRVIGEYSGTQRHLPVTQTTIAVGIDRVELSPAALGGFMGETPGGTPGICEYSGPLAEVTFRFDCYKAQSEPFDNHFIENIYETLLPLWGITRIWCEPIRSEKQALASHLRIFAAMRILLAAGQESVEISQIILQRRNSGNANN